jgi:ribosome-associated translation inhibitor RaiA
MSENEQAFNFDFEFQNRLEDDGQMKQGLQEEIDRRLRKLTRGNTDITGASIILENEDPAAQIPYLYRARIVLYTRPENIAADQTADTALGALKAALTAVERQVREKRDKLRERWKQPGAAQPEFIDPATVEADEDAGPEETP